jgi:hypothetical protein
MSFTARIAVYKVRIRCGVSASPSQRKQSVMATRLAAALFCQCKRVLHKFAELFLFWHRKY